VLSTDARWLIIKLGGKCNMVDFALSSIARSIDVSRFADCIDVALAISIDDGLCSLLQLVTTDFVDIVLVCF